MKKFIPFAVLAFIAVYFTSCEKEQALTPNPSFVGAPADGTTDENGSECSGNCMFATIDGVDITFPVSDYDTIFFGNFKFVGQFGNFVDFRSIRFDFEDASLPPVGTYPLDSIPGGVSARYDGDQFFTLNDSNIYDAFSGNLIITKATPELYEGTFSFDAKSLESSATVSITNGSFKASLREQ